MKIGIISHQCSSWLNCRKPILLGLLVVIGACSPVWLTLSGSELHSAVPGDIGLSLQLLAKDGTITAGEPLLARIKITNLSSEDFEFYPTAGNAPTTFLEVRDEKGQVIASTSKPPVRDGGLRLRYKLEHGKDLTWIWVLTALYDFEKPGRYTVCVQQLDLVKEGLPPIAEAMTSVQVLPADATRLEARCEEIFEPLRKHSSHHTDLPMSVRIKALYSVRKDVVLPYLEWLAREEHDKYACRAMLRMGTEKANSIVNALAARQDRVGTAARLAKKIASQPRDLLWDMGISDAPVPDRQ